MKNTTQFILFALTLVLSFQFTTACGSTNHYNPYNDLDADDGIIVITREVPADEYYHYNNEWENEDRYPVYDYRYGYSYRATAEYQERYEFNSRSYYEDYKPDYYNYHSNFQYRPNVYYTYDDYMRTYTAHECYVNPPYNQLIYVKCP